MIANPQKTLYLFTFTKEIFNKNRHFLGSGISSFWLAKIKITIIRELFLSPAFRKNMFNEAGTILFEYERVFQIIGIALPTEQARSQVGEGGEDSPPAQLI